MPGVRPCIGLPPLSLAGDIVLFHAVPIPLILTPHGWVSVPLSSPTTYLAPYLHITLLFFPFLPQISQSFPRTSTSFDPYAYPDPSPPRQHWTFNITITQGLTLARGLTLTTVCAVARSEQRSPALITPGSHPKGRSSSWTGVDPNAGLTQGHDLGKGKGKGHRSCHW